MLPLRPGTRTTPLMAKPHSVSSWNKRFFLPSVEGQDLEARRKLSSLTNSSRSCRPFFIRDSVSGSSFHAARRSAMNFSNMGMWLLMKPPHRNCFPQGRKDAKFWKVSSFNHLSANLFKQSEIDDFVERDLAEIFFRVLNLTDMNFQPGLAGGAVFAERFGHRNVSLSGDGGIDLPFALDDLHGFLGTLARKNETAIERPQHAFGEIAPFAQLTIGRSIAVARELDDVTQEQ